MLEELTVGVMFRNNEELVRPWFFFLRKATLHIKLNIIAVNQASEDNTAVLIQEELRENDSYVSPAENVGIARGRNLIIEEMKYRNNGENNHLLIMDSDIFIIRSQTVNNMVKYMMENPIAGVIESSVTSFWNDGKSDSGICFCLIRKEVFDAIGQFDPNFKMFWDDADFIHRMETVGFRRRCAPGTQSVHMWGETTRQGSEKDNRVQALEEDKLYYEKKHNTQVKEWE